MRYLIACILLCMTLAFPRDALAGTFVSRPVTGSQVIKMLYKFRGSHEAILAYGEISEAIARASTEDPLFPEIEEGSEVTASILVALAWHESNFRPTVVGDNGRSFGLYQIQPGTHKIDSKRLTVPRDASYIAIGLIRESIRRTVVDKGRDWREALSWYAASSEYGSRHPKIIAQSVSRMLMAAHLFGEFFPREETTPTPPTPFGRLLSQKPKAA